MIKNKKNKGILSFRTKAEVILVAFLLIGITTVSVMSVTRTITDSSDTVYTYIRNSNGNYWAATGANINTSINDLGVDGGTVEIPDGTIIITDKIFQKYKYNLTIINHGTLKLVDGGIAQKAIMEFQFCNNVTIRDGCYDMD